MNYNEYDKVILNFQKKIIPNLSQEDKKNYYDELIILKNNLLKDNLEYCKSIQDEKNLLQNKITDKKEKLENIIKLYNQKKKFNTISI